MRRILAWLAGAVVIVVIAAGVGGYMLFTRPQGEQLTPADAIVVLGGDRDGRIDYGLDLARQGYANTVVLSNSYGEFDPMIRQKCASGTATITVICFIPDPWTTRGEAMFVQRMAQERGWHHVIVVSWNYHLVRARYIFDQCFDGTVTMRAVPGSYDYNLAEWAEVYGYQYAAIVKAAVIGC
ncbi:MAG: YdcF family protein [Mycobacterium sp.]